LTACPQKGKGSPVNPQRTTAASTRPCSRTLCTACSGATALLQRQGRRRGEFRDSPDAHGKPPKWAKGKEPLAERLAARCRSAAGSGELAPAEAAHSEQGTRPTPTLGARKSEEASNTSAPGSGGLAPGESEEDAGVPRLVLGSRRSASTPTSFAVEGREDEVRSRGEGAPWGAQDKSQWEGLYGA